MKEYDFPRREPVQEEEIVQEAEYYMRLMCLQLEKSDGDDEPEEDYVAEIEASAP